MWTCIECEFKYSDDNGDSEERVCNSCLNKEETEKRERELMEEEKMEMLNEIRIRLGCPEDDEGTEHERDVIEEVEKLLLVERWLFQEAKEPVRSEALKWLSKFGYKEDE